MTEPGEADRDIRLGAADMDVEPAALQQQLPPRRGEAEQQLAEADDPAAHRASQPPSTARMWPLT